MMQNWFIFIGKTAKTRIIIRKFMQIQRLLQGSLAGRFEALLYIIYSIVLYERPFSISSPGQNYLYIFVCKGFDPGIQHLISRSEISRGRNLMGEASFDIENILKTFLVRCDVGVSKHRGTPKSSIK